MIEKIQKIDGSLQSTAISSCCNFSANLTYKNITSQTNSSIPSDSVSLASKTNNLKTSNLAIESGDNPYISEIQKVFRITPEINALPDFTKTPFKIGLVVAQKQVNFSMPNGRLFVETSQGKEEIANLENSKFTVKNENNSLAIYKDDKLIGNYQGKLLVQGNDPNIPVVINGKKYHGGMEIIINSLNSGSLNAINTVMLEDYLKGVVPAESPASCCFQLGKTIRIRL